jgi:phosphoenolpyruvate-protein phosphotransferase
MSTLEILAPMDGWCAPLEEVPDPVFAGRMLGDGLAIDPLGGLVVAPCAGQVVTVAAGGHAVSIRSAEGIEVLVHVGIDTVRLGGRGFEVLVRQGQSVAAGDALLRFDLDAIARVAKSLMTPIVVGLAEGLELRRRRSPGPVRAGELLFEIAGHATPSATPTEAGGGESEVRVLTVMLQHGIHARPAALLAQRLRAVAAQVSIEAHGKRADARSVVAIMSLGVGFRDTISVQAKGTGALAAIEAVTAGLEEALRAEESAAHAVPPRADGSGRAEAASERPARAAAQAVDGRLQGVVAVAGLAVGVAARIERPEIVVAEFGAGRAQESRELERARSTVKARLARVAEVGAPARREIVAAHVEFLDDPMLNEVAEELIASGKSAGFAWRTATRRSMAALAALADERLRERADDLLDVESHVLLALSGEARPMNLPIPERAVLLANELLPSELVALDRRRLAAICLGGGGATSHVAILAAAMDVPMLVGLGPAIQAIGEGAALIVDADRGVLETTPPAADIARAEARVAARQAERVAERAAAQSECRARDGTRVEIYANVGNVGDAAGAVSNGAEGCGLLRTEFLFIERETAPSEAEQLEAYQAIADALGGRPLVLRLMDIGGDKPLRYLPLPYEENPALGLRGIRTALWRKDLLRTQLRAALRVEPAGIVRVLLPMITDVAELRTVRSLVDELRAELGNRAPVEFGAMVETPAAALGAARLLREADFLSIGSNDLTQYTLAMDRGHAELAARVDALHPAVLQLIAATAAAGIEAGKTVAVCGGVAADPIAIPLLIGLGVRELSVVPAAVPGVKRLVRSLTIAACASLAARCLTLESAVEVRALVSQTSPPSGESR